MLSSGLINSCELFLALFCCTCTSFFLNCHHFFQWMWPYPPPRANQSHTLGPIRGVIVCQAYLLASHGPFSKCSRVHVFHCLVCFSLLVAAMQHFFIAFGINAQRILTGRHLFSPVFSLTRASSKCRLFNDHDGTTWMGWFFAFTLNPSPKCLLRLIFDFPFLNSILFHSIPFYIRLTSPHFPFVPFRLRSSHFTHQCIWDNHRPCQRAQIPLSKAESQEMVSI